MRRSIFRKLTIGLGLMLAILLVLPPSALANEGETAQAAAETTAGEHEEVAAPANKALELLLEKGVITQAEYDEAVAEERARAEAEAARTAEKEAADAAAQAAREKATEQANWLTKHGLKVKLGGFAEIDFVGDNTRSYAEIIGNRPVARNDTLAGQNDQFFTSPRNSRLTFDVQAPEVKGVKSRFFASMDFLGNQPQIGNDGVSEFSNYTSPDARIFQMFFQVHTPMADFKVGQDWSAFGFMSQYSRGQVSVAAMPANMFNRWVQASISHPFALQNGVTLTPVFSVERPPQRDAAMPSFVGGLQVAWSGLQASYNGASTGDVALKSLSFQVSGVGRRLEANSGGVTGAPGSTVNSQRYIGGWGVSGSLFVPILPSKNGKLGNTAHLVAEGVTGQGIADFFTGLSWGVCNPVCGNSTSNSGFGGNAFGQTNIDAGLAAVTRHGNFRAINTNSLMIHGTYYFPDDGKTWIGAGYGTIWSTNASAMTCDGAGATAASCGGATRSKANLYNRDTTWYGFLYHDFTQEIRAGIETNWVETKYSDGERATNRRIQASFFYRF
ncbi:MAG: hypothetical protein U0900_04465 [Myxococcota bacterium]